MQCVCVCVCVCVSVGAPTFLKNDGITKKGSNINTSVHIQLLLWRRSVYSDEFLLDMW